MTTNLTSTELCELIKKSVYVDGGLQWVDESDNPRGFKVYRKPDGVLFKFDTTNDCPDQIGKDLHTITKVEQVTVTTYDYLEVE